VIFPLLSTCPNEVEQTLHLPRHVQYHALSNVLVAETITRLKPGSNSKRKGKSVFSALFPWEFFNLQRRNKLIRVRENFSKAQWTVQKCVRTKTIFFSDFRLHRIIRKTYCFSYVVQSKSQMLGKSLHNTLQPGLPKFCTDCCVKLDNTCKN